MIFARVKERGIVLIAILWMSTLLIGFLALVSQHARTNAGMAMAISGNQADDLAIQSALAIIKKSFVDTKRLGGEFDMEAFRAAVFAQPDWPDRLDFAMIPNRSKINLKYLTMARMRRVLENLESVDADEIDPLIQAWVDWVDGDDNEMPEGAERSYYQKEGLENMPANTFFQVPSELLYVRGYRKAFSGVDLNSVFTVHGSHRGIDFNSAARETLTLIPGMTDEAVELIIESRKTLDLSQRSELALLLDTAVFVEVQTWIEENAVERNYSVAVFPESEQPPEYAYMEDLEFDVFWSGAKTLGVRPMAKLGEY